MPKLSYVHVSIAESIYRAFMNTKNEDLVSNIDKVYLYASCMAGRPEEKDYIMGFVDKYLSDVEKSKFFKKVNELKRKHRVLKFWESMELLDKFIPLLTLYRFIIRKKMIFLNDTIAVQKFHDKHVSKKKISIDFQDAN